MREAITRRRGSETPRQTAARLRAKHRVVLHEGETAPLSKDVFDDMWGET
jgi:antitoxin VapB